LIVEIVRVGDGDLEAETVIEADSVGMTLSDVEGVSPERL
jgi:hypothetical protein